MPERKLESCAVSGMLKTHTPQCDGKRPEQEAPIKRGRKAGAELSTLLKRAVGEELRSCRWSLRRIGAVLGVTRGRVQQIFGKYLSVREQVKVNLFRAWLQNTAAPNSLAVNWQRIARGPYTIEEGLGFQVTCDTLEELIQFLDQQAPTQ